MELAPICVFSYNRPEHLKRTLEALSKNDLAGDSVLYIFCDGAKELSNGVDKINVVGNTNTAKKYFDGTDEEYKRYLKSIDDNIAIAKSQTWPKELNVVVQSHNKGLAKSIVQGVTDVVNKYGKIVMLEDDIVTSVGFLKFMNDALEQYKDEDRVMHICGYMFPVKHKYLLPEIFFHPVPYPGGGWATWKRAWSHYNSDIAFLYSYWSKDWRNFNVWGDDLQKQLTMNYEGILNTWFIRWYASIRMVDGLSLYPHHSLTTNIGFDGSGQNCVALKTNKYWVKSLASNVNIKRIPIKSNSYAIYAMYGFWSGHWYSRRHRKEWKKRLVNLCSKIFFFK